MKGGGMKKDDDMDIGRWVDDRLAGRIPGDSWEPDVRRGLARLREGRRLNRGWGHNLLWVAAGSAAVCLPLMAFPVTRAVAQHCVSACVTQSGRLRELFMGKEPEAAPRLVFAAAQTRR